MGGRVSVTVCFYSKTIRSISIKFHNASTLKVIRVILFWSVLRLCDQYFTSCYAFKYNYHVYFAVLSSDWKHRGDGTIILKGILRR